MKTKTNTRQTPLRRPHIEHKAKSFKPKVRDNNPQPAAYRLMLKATPTDFLAVCFYPGMGDHSTAA